MTISQRVFYLLKEKGKKQNELAEFTGISTSTISAWNKRGTNPSADTISTLADFFGVSTDYLLTGEENYSTELSDDEKELLNNYNKLTDEDKKDILKRVEDLSEGIKHDIFQHVQYNNSREKEMLMLFKNLSEYDQTKLIGRAELLIEQDKIKENAG